jgi:hypothetical protein
MVLSTAATLVPQVRRAVVQLAVVRDKVQDKVHARRVAVAIARKVEARLVHKVAAALAHRVAEVTVRRAAVVAVHKVTATVRKVVVAIVAAVIGLEIANAWLKNRSFRSIY